MGKLSGQRISGTLGFLILVQISGCFLLLRRPFWQLNIMNSLCGKILTSVTLRTQGPLMFRGATAAQFYSSDSDKKTGSAPLRKAKMPVGRFDDAQEGADLKQVPPNEEEVYQAFPDDTNPNTGEVGGPKGPEPTRYGDWERKGRVIDF